MKRLVLVLFAVLLASCSAHPSSPSSSSTPQLKLTVFAAASLNEVLPKIADETYSFDGSAALVDQLKGGAPADVFASADKKTMDKAVEAGLIDGTPTQFASNVLVLVTPTGNPAGITGIDASLAGKKLVICAPEVPCGNATAKLAANLGITLRPVSLESKVTDVLGKVTSGEADAGVVYATDAKRAGDKVATLQLPGADQVPNTYWVGAVKGSPNTDAARAYIDLLSGRGRTVLAGAGFGPPL